MNNNEKGFALVLSLVLLLVMSLMGGALIVISAGDHQSNNRNEDYQQTFYVAETALLEGEKYILNQALVHGMLNHIKEIRKKEIFHLILLIFQPKLLKKTITPHLVATFI